MAHTPTRAAASEPRAGLFARLRRNLALQDHVCTAFHAYMFLRVMVAPDSDDARFARGFSGALLAVTVLTILVVRGELMRPGRLRALVYRIGVFTPVALSYFELRSLLAALEPAMLDQALWAVDRAVFGVTPAQWLQRINEPGYVEWFAFFYYSYFTILTAVLLPSLFFDRGPRMASLMVGAMTVVCVGHACYTLVPALGPHAAVAFDQPVRGGFFWGLVETAVHGAGAQMDIFPSLHTALPTFFTLHLFGNRHRAPFKYAWPVVGFFAANIIVATMLLRWHWGIDVICGLLLAALARTAGVLAARREQDRELGSARQPVWEPLFRWQTRPAPREEDASA